MRFPWHRREQRQDAVPESYTDARLAYLYDQALGASGDVQALAAAEIAAGVWGRAFMSAQVFPDNLATRAITPATLELIGRELIRRGEALFEMFVRRGQLELQPACNWVVFGDVNPHSWIYELNLAGPDETRTRKVAADRVTHLRYAVAPSEPWQGISPLANSRSTAGLAAMLERRLGEEVGGPTGSLIPVPDASDKKLQTDIANLKGRTALVETTSSGWQLGSGGAPRFSDWSPKRVGADPPETLPKLRTDAALHVLAACGVPTELLEAGEGTRKREAWRQFLHGTVQPVAKLVTAELAEKLDTPDLSLSFEGLFASDLQGRARSFQSMVGGGMDVAKAAALSGLLMPDDQAA